MPNAPGQGRKPKPKPNLKIVGGRGNNAPLTNAPLSEYPPPDWLTAVAREKWEELAPQLAGTRVLTDVDLHNLEVFCVAYANWRAAEAEIAQYGIVISTDFGPKKNPACTVSNECARRLAAFGAMLGLDPSSRSRLGTGSNTPQQANPFKGILKPK
ncbi:phage terminase small subunit P27 family [Chitinimonas lacunae]|uniref:Phage terminase small subunit P27 family n=1 Tax=Chitinimonas lacunae TaxID=1963018 RepID=A0ABV8MXC8_9NEIS